MAKRRNTSPTFEHVYYLLCGQECISVGDSVNVYSLELIISPRCIQADLSSRSDAVIVAIFFIYTGMFQHRLRRDSQTIMHLAEYSTRGRPPLYLCLCISAIREMTEPTRIKML